MTALRGLRGAVAAPFYLIVPPVLSVVFTYLTALIIGFAAGNSPRQMVDWRSDFGTWLYFVAVLGAGGLAIGLVGGTMGLQSARPAFETDNPGSWLGRASRSLLLAAFGGIVMAFAVVAVHTVLAPWAAILLVALVFAGALLFVIAAVIPDRLYRRHGEPERHGGTEGPKIGLR